MLRKLRKGIIELLLARCPNVKRIQELAEEYEVEKPRFVLGDQDCILWGLCVRACQEIIGKSAISLVNRGCSLSFLKVSKGASWRLALPSPRPTW